MLIDFSKIKKIYIIGIKGSGVVAIVEILKSFGIEILGSDVEEKFFSDEILADLGIRVIEKFDAKNIPPDADLIIFSTAYNEKNNVEMKVARKMNLPMMSYPEILAEIFNQKFGIAICGTHGKTTTSAMLASAMLDLERDPMATIGSKVIDWKGSALSGKGDFFVLEADEYQNKLSFYQPRAVVLTSLDFDHPDYFNNFSEYKKVFKDFIEKIPKSGFLVVWGDSVDTLEVAKMAQSEVLTYGFSEEADFRIISYHLEKNKTVQKFQVIHKNIILGDFEIKLAGKHNVLNACAVIAVCHKLNFDLKKTAFSLAKFSGTARRFQTVGERKGALLIDDYAHHPEEIRATLKGARERYPEKNIWVVFHPHTFTRTLCLLEEFSQSFGDADKVIVLDIYGSAREIAGGVHSRDLVSQINKYEREKAQYIAEISGAVDFLKDKISENDIVITMGAGNVWEVGDKLKL